MTVQQMHVKFEAYLLTERHVTSNTFSSYRRDIQQFISFLNKQSLAPV